MEKINTDCERKWNHEELEAENAYFYFYPREVLS